MGGASYLRTVRATGLGRPVRRYGAEPPLNTPLTGGVFPQCLYLFLTKIINMQRFFFLLLLAVATTFTVHAQSTEDAVTPETEETTSGPKMAFETMELDYGTIEQDSEPVRTFTFTNTGTEPVLIMNARGSCGCTVPTVTKAPVAPGESSDIKVRYDTHRIGQFRKRVTLTTNIPGDPIVLTIKGKVEAKPEEPAAVPAGEDGMFNGGGK